MTPKQKILFSQIQIAGLGIVIMVMAAVLEMPVFYYVGGAILIFGVLRYFMLKKLVDQNPFEDPDLNLENQFEKQKDSSEEKDVPPGS